MVILVILKGIPAIDRIHFSDSLEMKVSLTGKWDQ